MQPLAQTRTAAIHITLALVTLTLMNKDIRWDIVKLNACAYGFAGDIFTHGSTTCSTGEGKPVVMRGKWKKGRVAQGGKCGERSGCHAVQGHVGEENIGINDSSGRVAWPLT